MRVIILDGYTDEPAGLGVPPYLDVYPRYVAGAVWSIERNADIRYFTIDEVRRDTGRFIKQASTSDLVIFIAGVCVPGKYLGGEPIKPWELIRLAKLIEKPIKIIGGPVAQFGLGFEGGRIVEPPEFSNIFDVVVKGDVEVVTYRLIEEGSVEKIDPSERRPSQKFVSKFAIRGAGIATQHPCYGLNLICEVETYRGCPRAITGGCSFCIEPLKGLPDFRPVEDVVEEVKALYSYGVKSIRLGRQPDFFTYHAENVGEVEFPKPKPEAIRRLLHGIRSVAPNLRTLHIDNVNPGTVYHHREEAKEIIKIIIEYHTPGDVAAFGIESADPRVVRINGLKVMPDEAFEAIKIVNEYGSARGWNGLPHLLPGINLVHGLIGETKETYRLNYKFLEKILSEKLLVRRINIRQVMVFQGTRMWSHGSSTMSKHKEIFRRYKEMIRRNIDLPMIRMVVPRWTILRECFIEKNDGKLTYARQVASYPILICSKEKLEPNRFMDFIVLNHGYRSVTGIPYPIDINHLDRKTLEDIPGITKLKASRIVANRPFKNLEELKYILNDNSLLKTLEKHIVLN